MREVGEREAEMVTTHHGDEARHNLWPTAYIIIQISHRLPRAMAAAGLITDALMSSRLAVIEMCEAYEIPNHISNNLFDFITFYTKSLLPLL